MLAWTAAAAVGAAAAAPTAADEATVRAFRAECAARAQAACDAGTMTVAGEDGWLFLHSELRHISVGRFWGDEAAKVSRAAKDADPLPAILDYKDQLDKLGIELVLLPVPPKAVVYPDKLCKAVRPDARGVPPRLDAAHREFYKLLADKGVAVLDLTDDFLAARAAPASPEVFCRQDTHWSAQACIHAARKAAELVRGRQWLAAVNRQSYVTQTVEVQIAGDLWRDLKGAKPPQEKLPLRFVGAGGGAGGVAALEPDPASPILLLGDSHALVFHMGGDMHAKGAGLADQLAFEFGCPLEVVAVKGSGATPARISLYRKQKATPGYLATKKLLIWCFAAREFTEADGWRLVPVTREGT